VISSLYIDRDRGHDRFVNVFSEKYEKPLLVTLCWHSFIPILSVGALPVESHLNSCMDREWWHDRLVNVFNTRNLTCDTKMVSFHTDSFGCALTVGSEPILSANYTGITIPY